MDVTTAPLVYRPPGVDAVTVMADLDYGSGDPSLRMDVYRPVGMGPWPAVLFIHGDGDPEWLRGAKDWGSYTGWGRAVAACGMLGVTFSHRSWEGLQHIQRKVTDVEAAIRFVQSKGRSLGAEPGRYAIWSASAGVPVGLSTAIRTGVDCAVAYYGPMDIRAWSDDPRAAEVSPMALLEQGCDVPPLLVARAGLDNEQLNESIDAFVNAAWEKDLPVELFDHSEGHHGFDVVDDDERSREIIAETLAFLSRHLLGG